ncbi:uncharacterized protein BO96DRAFT_430590 [Aspergillus niger CBS 101883]|uniref:Contig An07c0370, genomic contig n=2 Tax=Aspergillus niger TaxID=5061 RepID=A2QPL1_ASPNC|nr:uncharacterized protein BO96DRAFT_430590 [Aspergillus niger CBS 101883]XP_059601107.1 uncharacterized protein An07g09820 [Aspergillus niger]PYH60664.1 hypothetical protein BO96DRAFT_430590 [Aspergillus niger CBS 101883]CAK39748.1 unnamed protein product [Aspergillus niger]
MRRILPSSRLDKEVDRNTAYGTVWLGTGSWLLFPLSIPPSAARRDPLHLPSAPPPHLLTSVLLPFAPGAIMAATQKLYPRATVKRVVKAHSNRNVSKNADILIFLDYMLFMQELMRESSIQSRKAGEKNISPNSVRKVTEADHEFPPV